MLYLIGLGLQPQHLTLEALNAIKGCSIVLLETYTSRYSLGTKEELEQLIEKKVQPVNRKKVEEDFAVILGKAKKENIALLVFGNPLVATTHIQLILDAQKDKIPIKLIPGISILDLVGKTGLDVYKFGRITTIVFQDPQYHPDSFFDVIEKNSANDLHSLCLLDIQSEEDRLMKIPEAIEILEKIAKKKNSTILEKNLLIGLYSVGNSKEKILSGTARELKKFSSTAKPQSLIVCAALNEKEKESLQVLKGAAI
ncbi:diphthine synthase [Candidatus Micrarchaeota archaeon]|nr:diphthine synthase [Candidatus Micrarchaeota archaeon]MBU1930940.1 diphthine synthase [Candidatus Micrarchaeota archaeon]